MQRSGVADLRLHPGRAPSWLLDRMKHMADALFVVMVDEHGTAECLRRLGDPLWFQALSNVLGYDWDSSGSTTVTCGVLRSVLQSTRHGLAATGGKGARSRRVPKDLQVLGDQLGFGDELTQTLIYASRMTAKVDSAALQDGHQLYHHTFFLDTENGQWTVVQQGMNAETGTSRRYHWVSEDLADFIEEPHSGIITQRRCDSVLDMTARASRGCRKTSVALACEDSPNRLRNLFYDYKPSRHETTLLKWSDSPSIPQPRPRARAASVPPLRLFPERMDWDAVRRVYDVQPSNFEQLLAVRGVGPATIRGLALLSDMCYGEAPSWEDPVRMTFAFGGKDGVPFPVNRKAYDEAIAFLNDAIDRAKLDQKARLDAFRRLRHCLPARSAQMEAVSTLPEASRDFD
jgi:hypothetical protein